MSQFVDCSMTDNLTMKRVLVEFGNSRKPVCFVCDSDESDLSLLKKAIVTVFKIEDCADLQNLLVQVKSEAEEWKGIWVDIEEHQEIADKSVLKAVLREYLV